MNAAKVGKCTNNGKNISQLVKIFGTNSIVSVLTELMYWSSVNLISKSGNLDDWTLDGWAVGWLEICTI